MYPLTHSLTGIVSDEKERAPPYESSLYLASLIFNSVLRLYLPWTKGTLEPIHCFQACSHLNCPLEKDTKIRIVVKV